MDCSRVPLGGSRLKFALTCKQFAAIVADNNLRLPGCTGTSFRSLALRKVVCFLVYLKSTTKTSRPACFMSQGKSIGWTMRPAMIICNILTMMGWDLGAIMIMSKSGLFCLNLSLCEKGCGIIRIPWKAKQIPSLRQLGGITPSKVQQTYQFKQGLGISFQHSEFLASDSCAGDSLESQPPLYNQMDSD
jgi:hypothetical protein